MGRKIAIIVLAALASCTSYKRCLDKFGTIERERTVKIDTLEVIRPVDSIRHVLDTSRYVVKESERARLIVHRDTIVCMAKSDTIHHFERTVEVREKPVFKDNPNRFPWWSLVLMGMAGGLMLVFITRLARA